MCLIDYLLLANTRFEIAGLPPGTHRFGADACGACFFTLAESPGAEQRVEPINDLYFATPGVKTERRPKKRVNIYNFSLDGLPVAPAIQCHPGRSTALALGILHLHDIGSVKGVIKANLLD